MRGEFKEIALESINSTNRWAKEHIAELPDRSIVTAKIQTEGRGRLNRSWVDLGEGNLFLSFVLKPDLEYRENFPNITQYLSVVLARVLENYGVRPQIKWPNDVLVNGKKIAGILAETSMSQTTFNGIILGIGVNLNARMEDFTRIDKPATALNLETGMKIDLKEFKNTLCKEFFEHYDEFIQKGFSCIIDEYTARACFINKELTVALVGETLSGVANGVTERGELILTQNIKDIILNIGDIL